ncbi:hypothetical protein [Micromonospora sediminimaris]|uniref:Uncharacterized protein n=1 Tax=Micromonospora sediminimaris TaxID=547162 RepID=A0A9W5USA4_9ACTN|nr:hypothetical protein [Micromonospora sediminimaris]GIJ34126.1 hypothetical protein Vse01_32740 [Micromonospora sediminimaris]SFD56809.1 hypothetical protein SAMN05216284_11933 [Micromonospora sediminimaris]
MPPPAGSQVSRVPAQRTPPEELAPPAVAPAPRQPRRRLRTVLTVVAGVVAVLCLTGGVVGYFVYDRATTLDRSTPAVVVDNYLRAYLVDRNDARSRLFSCEGVSEFETLRRLRDDLAAREERFGTTMWVSWERFQVDRIDGSAEVRVDLTFAAQVDGIRQSDRQSWTFTTRLGEDWRVCSAVPG